jgi:hypothetical protein
MLAVQIQQIIYQRQAMNLSTGKELEKAVWELFNQKQKSAEYP